MNSRTFIAAITALTLITIVRVASTHRVFSETLDEPVHVAAGYQWLTAKYRIDLHSPPLGRILSGLSLRLAGVPAPPPGTEVEQGNFLFYYGDRYEKNLARARMGTLVWLIVAIVTLAAWARRTFSPAVAIVAVALFTTLPPILGHGGLATNDIALVATLTLALFACERFLEARTIGHGALLGVAIGAGVITKFSFIAFFPPCALVLAVVRWKRGPWAWRAALVAVAAAFVTIWAGYQFEVARPATIHPDAMFVFRFAAPARLSDFAGWAAAHVPIPAPGLLTGLGMVKLHEQAGHLSFLLGKHSETGWWYYFPVVFFFKTPIPFLLLAAWGTVLAVRMRKGIEHVLMPLAMLLVVMPASLNIGLRYLLPAYVSLSMIAALAVVEIWRRAADAFSRAALAGVLTWLFIGVAVRHPDYLAWFNELARPVPSRIAVDSNLDWGQDVLRLAREVRARNIDSLWTILSTNAQLERHGIRAQPLPPGHHVRGWIAVGETPFRLLEQHGGYKWLSAYRPVMQIGGSIRLYWIPPNIDAPDTVH
ncbi:MAG TPA: glycosyltransferase family 39 protein [Thermoanaerobaculia bacterium]|nr:glycosyltransferase family 39 protein [Thermoanaerobaculia bacterium]